MQRVKVEVTEGDKTAALAAIDRGVANLLTAGPKQSRDDWNFAPAIESLVMGALDSDGAGKNKKVIEADYLPWMKEQFRDAGVQWNGVAVTGITKTSSPMYNTAIATLFLAELAPRYAEAKALAERGERYLLGGQLGEGRPAAWRPVMRTSPHFGGWRYHPWDMDADLSVSGWCIIALNACAVADIQPEGVKEAMKDAVGFVKKTQGREGFGYQFGGSGGAGAIRDAIGALVFQLYGEHSKECDGAMAYLDNHLFAGTQSGDLEQDYPLYYAYYATRLHYLRGGTAWEAWRMATIRELVKLQRADGSWGAWRKEAAAGPQRYATALSVLILRMCLNDEPAYMTQEVKGF
jgi:hypothetical protein